MPQTFPVQRDSARPRWRSAITTTLTILLAVLIVRDILARRWGSAPPPSSDVTHRLP